MKVPISREGREKWGTPAHRAGRSRRLRLRVAADVRSFTGPLARFGITDILGCLEVCRLRSEAGREPADCVVSRWFRCDVIRDVALRFCAGAAESS
jgi:hypothetical protein